MCLSGCWGVRWEGLVYLCVRPRPCHKGPWQHWEDQLVQQRVWSSILHPWLLFWLSLFKWAQAHMIADGLWVLGHRKVRAVRIRRELSLPSLCSGTRTTVFEPGFGFMGSRLQGGGCSILGFQGRGKDRDGWWRALG